jgi:hypothetical protein
MPLLRRASDAMVFYPNPDCPGDHVHLKNLMSVNVHHHEIHRRFTDDMEFEDIGQP